MSDIKYGLISKVDAETLEKTIDLICEDFYGEEICITEIGLYSGLTAKGLYEYITSKEWASGGSVDFDSENFSFECKVTGVDNNKDGEPLIHFPKNGKLIIGNSNEVYNQIPDNSQHLVFLDGCHCFAHVVSDFFCYAPKVKVGGFLAFHDTGAHIKPFKDFQHGDKENPDAYISVRKALNTIGLFNQNWGSANYDVSIMESHIGNKDLGWELIYDEADPENDASGICCFKKLL